MEGHLGVIEEWGASHRHFTCDKYLGIKWTALLLNGPIFSSNKGPNAQLKGTLLTQLNFSFSNKKKLSDDNFCTL